MSESFTLDTPEQIAVARVIAGLKGIQLELRTGMKPTRGWSGVKFAKQYGYTGRTLKGAAEYLERLLNP